MEKAFWCLMENIKIKILILVFCRKQFPPLKFSHEVLWWWAGLALDAYRRGIK